MAPFRVFWWHFWHILELHVTFWHFFCTSWIFWAFYAVFSRNRFVVIYALLQVKYFWLKPCLCKKKSCLFACLHVHIFIINPMILMANMKLGIEFEHVNMLKIPNVWNSSDAFFLLFCLNKDQFWFLLMLTPYSAEVRQNKGFNVNFNVL